jgi:threonine dehydratase
MIKLANIERAAERIGDQIHRTPIFPSRTLGDRVGVDLFLKCECFQKTGSFKPRGALNKILSLTPAEQEAGLITVSAGNHAQAVAWAASRVMAPCTVIMPDDAPRSKTDAVRAYGAEIVFHPDRATLFSKLEEEKEKRGATFIHPFDDPTVLAGAGTTGLEIMEDLPETDVVIVPVGGGGLMGGVVSAVKAMSPDTRVVAVELEAGPGLKPALESGRPVTVKRPVTLADGMTPPFVGKLPLEIAKEGVDELALVSEQEIIQTMKLLMTRCKLFVEASGAAATAALLHGRIFEMEKGATVVSIVTGGNVDLETVRLIV